eukprot:3445247-Rhodomonas_salina.1
MSGAEVWYRLQASAGDDGVVRFWDIVGSPICLRACMRIYLRASTRICLRACIRYPVPTSRKVLSAYALEYDARYALRRAFHRSVVRSYGVRKESSAQCSVLCARYAMCGTRIGCYAMSSTEVGYGAMRPAVL